MTNKTYFKYSAAAVLLAAVIGAGVGHYSVDEYECGWKCGVYKYEATGEYAVIQSPGASYERVLFKGDRGGAWAHAKQIADDKRSNAMEMSALIGLALAALAAIGGFVLWKIVAATRFVTDVATTSMKAHKARSEAVLRREEPDVNRHHLDVRVANAESSGEAKL